MANQAWPGRSSSILSPKGTGGSGSRKSKLTRKHGKWVGCDEYPGHPCTKPSLCQHHRGLGRREYQDTLVSWGEASDRPEVREFVFNRSRKVIAPALLRRAVAANGIVLPVTRLRVEHILIGADCSCGDKDCR